MKTVTLLAALTLVTAVTQHAIAADLCSIKPNSTPGLPAGPGECATGFCGTPGNNGGGGGSILVGPQEPTPDPCRRHKNAHPRLRKEALERRATLRAARRPGAADRHGGGYRLEGGLADRNPDHCGSGVRSMTRTWATTSVGQMLPRMRPPSAHASQPISVQPISVQPMRRSTLTSCVLQPPANFVGAQAC
jgi:hypothetical protein